MTHPIIQQLDAEVQKRELPDFAVGDTVEVRTRIKEGDKERLQPFIGIVTVRKSSGASAMFTVRRIVQGEGVERTFPLYSPLIDSIEVLRSGRTRRARLFYLRRRVGKGTRLKERRRHAPETPGTQE